MDCNCEGCVWVARIKAVWDKLDKESKKLVDDLFGAMEVAQTDATYWKLRHRGEWPCKDSEAEDE